MSSTSMWREIQDQPEVAQRVFESYSDQTGMLNAELAGKKQVFLMGTGASLNACLAAQHAFIKYGGFIPYVFGATEIDHLIDRMDRDTVVILVSQSGQSLETRDVVARLKSREVELWGITNDPESALGQSSDRVLPLYAGHEVSSATKTYTASVMILYMLAAGRDREAMDQLSGIPEKLNNTLEMAEGPIAGLAQELKAQQVIYVVGMGLHGAVALQGALMIKEKTFIHTDGMCLSEFRHGTVEVVNRGLPVMISAATQPMVDQALRQAEYLTGLSADIHLVLDRQPESSPIPQHKIIRFANMQEEVFSHVTAALPFQLLAEAIAGINGYDVDGFRHLSKVVDSY